MSMASGRDSLEFQTVVLAALLHDMGKLLQRGSTELVALADIRGKHPAVSSVFASAMRDVYSQVADPALLQLLVQRHHENARSFPPDELVFTLPENSRERVLAAMVSLADNLSSRERGERIEQRDDEDFVQRLIPFRLKPLTSVFANIAAAKEGTEKARLGTPLRFTPGALPPTSDTGFREAVFPRAGMAQFGDQDMNVLLKAFGLEYRRRFMEPATQVDISRFDAVLSHTLAVLQQFAWCIPANTQEDEPDVSLYDHLRTTAAIAACLYRHHEAYGDLSEAAVGAGRAERAVRPDRLAPRPASPERFLLVLGDISGIQNYIFSIASTGVGGGVAKRLRARSLYVQVLAEVTALQLLRRSGVPLCNALMTAGGKFYLLLPNTPAVRESLEEYQGQFDAWCLKELHGELRLHLAWAPGGDERFDAGGGDRSGFSQWTREVNELAGEAKRRPLKRVLTHGGHWQEDTVLQEWPAGHGKCASCSRFPAPAGEWRPAEERLCAHCTADREAGRAITKRRYLAFLDNDSEGEIKVNGWSVSADHTGRSPVLVLHLNSPDVAEHRHHPAAFRFLANHVPRQEDLAPPDRPQDDPDYDAEDPDAPATFEQIARQAQGRELLGYLKMDVDNLGRLFAFGLKGARADGRSKDTISRQATLSRALDWFFCGHVQHLLEKDFPACYSVFSGGDDSFVVGPWSDMPLIAQRIHNDFEAYTGHAGVTVSAGIFLARPEYPIARAQADVERTLEQAKGAGKDRIALLRDVAPWSEWGAIVDTFDKLAHWKEEGAATQGFLYSLLEYGRMWRRYLAWRDAPQRNPAGVLGLRFQPLLAYQVRRNLEGENKADLGLWAERFTTPQPFTPAVRSELDHLPLITELAILRTWGGRHDAAL